MLEHNYLYRCIYVLRMHHYYNIYLPSVITIYKLRHQHTSLYSCDCLLAMVAQDPTNEVRKFVKSPCTHLSNLHAPTCQCLLHYYTRMLVAKTCYISADVIMFDACTSKLHSKV
jgi:hypothetical protein